MQTYIANIILDHEMSGAHDVWSHSDATNHPRVRHYWAWHPHNLDDLQKWGEDSAIEAGTKRVLFGCCEYPERASVFSEKCQSSYLHCGPQIKTLVTWTHCCWPAKISTTNIDTNTEHYSSLLIFSSSAVASSSFSDVFI